MNAWTRTAAACLLAALAAVWLARPEPGRLAGTRYHAAKPLHPPRGPAGSRSVPTEAQPDPGLPSAAVSPSLPTSVTTPALLRERDAGYAEIAARQRAGQFDSAAAFALTSPPAFRRDLVIAAFNAWAEQQPENALTAALRIDEPTSREWAIQSALTGWARREPAALAEFALRLPAGAEHDAALTKALRAWMHCDPSTAGDWILSHDSHVVAVADAVFHADQR